MVVPGYFQDILKCFDNNAELNLPPLNEKSLKLEYIKSDVPEVVYNQKPILPFAASDVYNAYVGDFRRLSADNPKCKPIYEITFDLQNNDINYKPGDTIGIIPRNNKDEVARILNHLEINDVADCGYTLSLDTDRKTAKIPPHVPTRATLRHTLTYCVDLRGIVKKIFLMTLSIYTKDESERKVLEYLSSKEGFLAYTSHILNKSICLLDIIQIFISCKPPIEVILEYLPRLLPRPYSICSSYLKNPEELKICFSVQDIGNDRKGLTTGWLEDLIKGSDDIDRKLEELCLYNESMKIPIYFRKNVNDFRMPENLSAPIIFIGPGTGVSPFLGFLEEREYFLNKYCDMTLGYTWLVNGCRCPELDYIYEEELRHFVSKGVLNKLSTAFSRMENSEYRYVQNVLEKHGAHVAKLIEDGAYIFVCGDVNKIDKEVKTTIIKCIEKHSNKTIAEAEQILSDLEKEKRYVVDVWN